MTNSFIASQKDLRTQFNVVEAKKQVISKQINEFDDIKLNAQNSTIAEQQQIQEARKEFNQAWTKQETEITKFAKGSKDPVALQKIYADLKNEINVVIIDRTSQIQTTEKIALFNEIDALEKARQDWFNKEEEEKKFRFYHAFHVLDQKNKPQPQNNFHTAPHNNPANTDGLGGKRQEYETMVQNFKNDVPFKGITFIKGVGKDKNGNDIKDSIVIDSSGLPWKKEENEEKMADAVLKAAIDGWYDITITGGKENERIAAMKQALTLPGMKAQIKANDGETPSKEEEQWNALLAVKLDLKQPVSPERSELTEIYSELKSPKSPKPHLVAPFLSALHTDHVAEIVENLKNPPATIQAPIQVSTFYKDLTAFITDTKNEKSPIVKNFGELGSEVKVETIFEAANQEEAALKGERIELQRPNKIKPFLEKLDFAEAYQLMHKVEGTPPFPKGRYNEWLRLEIEKQAINSRKNLDFKDAKNLDAFTALSSAGKANMYHRVLDPKHRTNLLAALDNKTQGLGSQTLFDMYQNVGKNSEKQAEQQALFLSESSKEDIERIVDGLTALNQALALDDLYKRLGNAIIKNSKCSFAQDFAGLSDTIKTRTIFEAAKLENQNGKTKPEALKPYLEKLNFAEAYQLMKEVETLQDNDYRKALKRQIEEQAVRVCQKNPLNFIQLDANNKNANLEAFKALNSVEQANLYHDVLDARDRGNLMKALDNAAAQNLNASSSAFLIKMYDGLTTQKKPTPEKQQSFLSKSSAEDINKMLIEIADSSPVKLTEFRQNIGNAVIKYPTSTLAQNFDNLNLSLIHI